MGNQVAILAVSAAGAYAGSLVGQPALGWAIGSAIGARLFAEDLPDQEGPRLEDLTVQASTYGASIAKVYGTRIVAGNVIWKTDIKETKHETDVDAGKGGGQSQTQISYTYSLSFAVGLCEGEIDGISRVFADGKLIFDFSTDASFTEINQIEQETRRGILTIYRGTETQTADPVIESFEGSGNVPGFRGLAYIVFDDMQLADYGNRMPNITAEVVDNGSLALKTMVVENGLGATVQGSGRGYVYEGIPEIMTDGFIHPNARIKSFDWDGNLIDDEQAGENVEAAETGTTGMTAIYQPVNATAVGGGLTAGTLANVAYRKMGVEPNRVLVGPPLGDHTDPAVNKTTFLIPGPYHPSDPKNVYSGFCVGAAGNDSYLFFSEISGGFTQKRMMKYFAPGSSGVIYDCNVTNVVGHDIEAGVQTLDFLGEGNSCICFESDGVNVWYGNNGSGGTLQWFTWDQAGNFTLQNTWTGFGFAEPFGAKFGCLADNGVCIALGDTSDDLFIATRVETVTASDVNISDIVSDLCVRSGLTTGDIDVTSLTDTVHGFSINRPTSARGSLQVLQKVAFFDIIESDWILEFKKRGTASVRSLSTDDMCAAEDMPNTDTVINTTRTQEKDLPKVVKVQYLSKPRDQQVSEQSVRRIITQATNEVSERLPIVMTDNKARQVAEVLCHAEWESRDLHEISLSVKHLDLEPGDVVTFTPETGDPKQARIVGTAYQAGQYKVSMVSEEIDSYVSEHVGEETNVREQVVPILGPAEGYILDLPVMQDAHNQNGVYTAGRGKLPNWPGGQIYQSLDDGVTFDPWSLLPETARIGSTIGVFASALPDVWDRGTTLDVKLKDPTLTLTSSTEAAVLNGANTAIVGADGRWEVIGFVNATLTGTGEYTLDTFIRGRKGSTDYIDQHADNDTFILMETTRSDRVYVPISEYLVSRTYRAVTIGRLISTTTNFDKQYFAESYKCYRVGDLRAVKKSDQTLDVEWKHAVRYSGEWNDLIDVPDDETSLLFDVSVYDNVTGELVAFAQTANESVTFETILGGGDTVDPLPTQRMWTLGNSDEYAFLNTYANGATNINVTSVARLINLDPNTTVSIDTNYDEDIHWACIESENIIYRARDTELSVQGVSGLDLDSSTDLGDTTYSTTSQNYRNFGVSDDFVWAQKYTIPDTLEKLNPDLTVNNNYALPTALTTPYQRLRVIAGNATHVFMVPERSLDVWIFSISGGTFTGPHTWAIDNSTGFVNIQPVPTGAILYTWTTAGGDTQEGVVFMNNSGTIVWSQLSDTTNPGIGLFGQDVYFEDKLFEGRTKMLLPYTDGTSLFYEIRTVTTGAIEGYIPRDGWIENFELPTGEIRPRTYGALFFLGSMGPPSNEYLVWTRSNFYSSVSGNAVITVTNTEVYRTGGAGAGLPELRVEVHQVSSTSQIGRGSVNSVIVPA